jgi:hypothetical protein
VSDRRGRGDQSGVQGLCESTGPVVEGYADHGGSGAELDRPFAEHRGQNRLLPKPGRGVGTATEPAGKSQVGCGGLRGVVGLTVITSSLVSANRAVLWRRHSWAT